MEAEMSFRSNSVEGGRPVAVGACDMCRKKKIRCDPTTQGCTTCTKHGRRCHFTPIATNRKPRRPAGFKYIAQLEQRLLGLETLLVDREMEQPSVSDNSSQKEQTTTGTMFDTVLINLPGRSISWMPEDEEQVPSTEQSKTLWPDHTSPFLIQNYNNVDLSILGGYTAIQTLRPAPELRPVSLVAPQQLPTKTFALELIGEAFSKYNKFMPIFDEEEFLTEFHIKYSISNTEDAGWWACLNVVLAIAHRLRAIRTSDPIQDNYLAGGYIRNALSVVSDLNLCKRNLSTVQALVGMACILQGTPNPEPAAMLVAAALRLAQAMDMHREGSGSGLNNNEVEKRRRVFWKLYILDKDISLRTGRPFGQDDDEMDVCLPSNESLNSSSLNHFNCRIGLALVQGQVYKRLYSVGAGKQTAAQRALEAQELTSLLSYWKIKAQLELLEDSTIISGFQLSGEMVHKVVLTLTYFHCLSMIDRHLSPATRSSSDQHRNWSDLCVAESRKAIRLVQAIPQGDCACTWMLLDAFFSAAGIILSNLTHDPTSTNAISDLDLVEPFRRLLNTLAGDPSTRSSQLLQMQRNCNNLTLEAKDAVRSFGLGPPALFI